MKSLLLLLLMSTTVYASSELNNKSILKNAYANEDKPAVQDCIDSIYESELKDTPESEIYEQINKCETGYFDFTANKVSY